MFPLSDRRPDAVDGTGNVLLRFSIADEPLPTDARLESIQSNQKWRVVEESRVIVALGLELLGAAVWSVPTGWLVPTVGLLRAVPAGGRFRRRSVLRRRSSGVSRRRAFQPLDGQTRVGRQTSRHLQVCQVH